MVGNKVDGSKKVMLKQRKRDQQQRNSNEIDAQEIFDKVPYQLSLSRLIGF